jgi:hypothetical protein
MIDFLHLLAADGRHQVRQELTHPAAYLDTWALRLFAEGDPQLERGPDYLLPTASQRDSPSY